MRTIRALASLILLPAAIGLLVAYVWHACTARWDIPAIAVVGLALVAGAVAELADRLVRHALDARRRSRLPARQPRHRRPARTASKTTPDTYQPTEGAS